MFDKYLRVIVAARDDEKQIILADASEKLTIQEMELLSSAARLSMSEVKEKMFDALWEAKKAQQ